LRGPPPPIACQEQGIPAILDLDKPVVRARYDYADLDAPGLAGIVDAFLDKYGL